MAFTTSINGSILVPSRILLVFAEDRILPEFKLLRSAACVLRNRSTTSSSRLIRGFLLILATVFSCLAVAFNLTAISQRFRTPHVSLIISFIISVTLIWTGTIDYMLSIALQGVFILYVIHGAAVIALPFVRPTLYSKAKTRFCPTLIVLTGLFSMTSIAWFSRQLFIGNTSAIRLIIVWVVIGTLLYAVARWEGKKDGHDYAKRLIEEWQ
jgi:amino acid transporter